MSNQISEEAPAKEKSAPAAAEGGVEQNSEKTIRQAVYDIRYRARREELDLRHAFSQYMGSSNLNQQEKAAVQEKLFGKEGGSPAAQAEELAFESVSLAMEKVFVLEGNPVQKAWNKFVPPPSQSANPNVRSGKLTPGKLEAGALKTMNKTAETINKPIKAASSASKAVKGAVDTVSKTVSKAKDAVQPVTKAVTGAAKTVGKAVAKNPKTAAIVAGGALAAGLAGKAIADRKKKKKKDVKESASEQKYKVRVQDKEKPAYVRYADRAKINQLRSNPQISSVEMTGHGDPYEGDKDKKPSTSSIQKKGKKDEVSGKDKKIDLKKEGYVNENRMASHTAGMSDGQKASASSQISKGLSQSWRRRLDKSNFGDRKKAGKRGNPEQYRKSADSPENELRYPYGKSNIGQGKGSFKDLSKVKKEEVTNEALAAVPMVAGKVALGGAKLAGKAALGGAKLAGKAAVGGAKLAGKATVKTAKVAGNVGKKVGKAAGKQAARTAMGTAHNAYKVGSAVVNRTGRAAAGAVKGALSNEEYLADGAAVAPPKNKKITGEKVDNSKLIKVFPQDQSDPQIGNIKSSYKPVGQVVSEILAKEDMNKGYVVTAADKKGNTPAWQGYKAGKKKKDGSPLYRPADHLKNEGVEVKMEGDDDTPATVDALTDVINSKNNDDSRAMYTKWNLAKNKLRAAGLKCGHELEGEMTEGIIGKATGKVVGGVVGGVENLAVGTAKTAAKTGAKVAGSVVKRTGRAAAGAVKGALSSGKKEEVELTGNNVEEGVLGAASGAVLGGALTGGPVGALAGGALGSKVDVLGGKKKKSKRRLKKEGYTNVVEDITDILARLEKKRISKGGNPDESPLGKKTGRAMKAQQDKVRKKAGLKTEHHQKDADGNTIPHEEINELKTSTLRSYVNRASVDAVGRGVDAGIKGMTGPKKEMEKNMTKAYKRQRGINTAANKLASRAERKENFTPESTIVRDILVKKN